MYTLPGRVIQYLNEFNMEILTVKAHLPFYGGVSSNTNVFKIYKNIRCLASQKGVPLKNSDLEWKLSFDWDLPKMFHIF